MLSWTIFETKLGQGALSYSPAGLVSFQLPRHDFAIEEAYEDLALHSRGDQLSHAPTPIAKNPGWVQDLIAEVQEHLDGKPSQFKSLKLDLKNIPPFHAKVYRALTKVQAGSVVSYGQLAAMAGSPNSARAVGTAMSKNPFCLVIPCHRVVAAGGRLGGYSGVDGIRTKTKLLKMEGFVVSNLVP
jgi:methylated-DNA-[protein]-cysteine S-methyltransferase